MQNSPVPGYSCRVHFNSDAVSHLDVIEGHPKMTFYDSEPEAPRQFFHNGGFKMAAIVVIMLKICHEKYACNISIPTDLGPLSPNIMLFSNYFEVLMPNFEY